MEMGASGRVSDSPVRSKEDRGAALAHAPAARGCSWATTGGKRCAADTRCQGVDDDSGWTFDVSWPWLVDSWRAYPLIVNNQWVFL